LAKLAYYSTVPKKRSCVVEANTVSSTSLICGVLNSNVCVYYGAFITDTSVSEHSYLCVIGYKLFHSFIGFKPSACVRPIN